MVERVFYITATAKCSTEGSNLSIDKSNENHHRDRRETLYNRVKDITVV